MRSEICTADKVAIDEMLDQSCTVDADSDSKDGVTVPRYCATGVLCQLRTIPRASSRPLLEDHWSRLEMQDGRFTVCPKQGRQRTLPGESYRRLNAPSATAQLGVKLAYSKSGPREVKLRANNPLTWPRGFDYH